MVVRPVFLLLVPDTREDLVRVVREEGVPAVEAWSDGFGQFLQGVERSVLARTGGAVQLSQLFPGGTLRGSELLPEGDYRISDAIRLGRSVTIMGEGFDRARILSSAEGSMLSFGGRNPLTFWRSGTLVLEDVALVRVSETPGNVLSVMGGHVELRDVLVAGG